MRGGRSSGFSPFREIWIRWVDGIYKTIRRWAMLLYLYLYALFMPNLMVFAVMIIIFSPLLLGLAAVTPPLLYLRENQELIFTELQSAGSGANVALQDVQDALNKVIRLIRPGIKIYNLTWNILFFIGLYMFDVLGCPIGTSECTTFETLWGWFGELAPWTFNLFYIAYTNLKMTLAPLFVFSNGAPSSLFMAGMVMNASLMGGQQQQFVNPDGSLVSGGGAAQFYSSHNGSLINDLSVGLDSHLSHRFVVVQQMPQAWRERIMRAANEYAASPPPFRAEYHPSEAPPQYNHHVGGRVPSPAPIAPSVPPATCAVCDVITDVVVFATNPDIFAAIWDLIKFIFQFGFITIKGWIEDALNFFFPFLEWLLDFVGGDLIGFFEDLFSKVAALFTWVGNVWDAFINVYNVAINAIFGQFATWVGEISGLFTSAYDFMSDTFDAFVSVIGGAVIAFVQNLLDDVNDILDNICDVCDAIIPSISCPGCRRKRGIISSTDSYYVLAEQLSHFILPSTIGRRIQLQHPMHSLNALAIGQLTATQKDYCWSVVRSGIDVFEIRHLSFGERVWWIACIAHYEYRLFLPTVQEQVARVRAGEAEAPLGLTAENVLGGSGILKRLNEKLLELNTTMERTRDEVNAFSKHARNESRVLLEQHTQRESRSAGGNGKPSWVWSPRARVQWHMDRLRMLYEGKLKSTSGGGGGNSTDPSSQSRRRSDLPLDEQVKQNAERLFAQHRVEELHASFKRVAETPQWKRLQASWQVFVNQTWRVDYMRVRHPRIVEENTIEWHAWRIREEARVEWTNLGKFLVRRPSALQLRDYLHANLTMLRGFYEMYRRDTGAVIPSHNNNNNNNKRDLGGLFDASGFFDWLTGDLWVGVGDWALDIINFYLECNPLPVPYGPGGMPNPNFNPPNGRYCAPYINPDTQFHYTVSFDILFPACCKPPHKCVGYDNGFEELRYLVRWSDHVGNTKWEPYVQWIPLLGPFVVDFANFPTNTIPADGWYCFAVSVGGLTELFFWTLVAFIIFISWILPITLCFWCYCNCCCVTGLLCCRLACFPCGLCKPRSHKVPQYVKDYQLLKEILPFIPGLGIIGTALRAKQLANATKGAGASEAALPYTINDLDTAVVATADPEQQQQRAEFDGANGADDDDDMLTSAGDRMIGQLIDEGPKQLKRQLRALLNEVDHTAAAAKQIKSAVAYQLTRRRPSQSAAAAAKQPLPTGATLSSHPTPTSRHSLPPPPPVASPAAAAPAPQSAPPPPPPPAALQPTPTSLPLPPPPPSQLFTGGAVAMLTALADPLLDNMFASPSSVVDNARKQQ